MAFEEGMAVAFDYGGSVAGWFDHIGILYRDDGDGVVGGEDWLLHGGPMEPTVSYLRSQGGAGEELTGVRLYRWKVEEEGEGGR